MLVSTGYNGHSSMTTRRTPTKATFGPNPLSNQSLRVPLIDSPLPSPSLPSITPRHGKKTKPRWRRRLGRLLFWLTGVSVIVWFGLSFLRSSEQSPSPINFMSPDGESYEIIGSDSLPDVPGPVLVTDKRGRSRWTVSIPQNAEFPLPPVDYARICTESMDLARHLEDTKGHGTQHHSAHHAYYYKDKNFMDTPDAQRHGLLPSEDDPDPISSLLLQRPPSHPVVGGQTYHSSGADDLPACDKSLTFVMQTEDAGFGATVMALWMSYGLAQKEGRAFFVDDTNWAYGDYTTYFQTPPMPSCRPPPVSQRVPCPHQARHLLVSTATTKWAFGHQFNDHFEDAHKMGVERQKPIFDLLRAGYEALFHLSGDDAEYLKRRTASLRADINDGKNKKNNGMIVGIHARHGDRHPFEYQYQTSYIPLDTYVQTSEEIITSSTSSSSFNILSDNKANPKSRVLIASDDPDVYTAPEATDLTRAQRFISLASKSSLDGESPPDSVLDNNTGWEGGFFSALFWSLGAPNKHHRHTGPMPSQRASSSSSSSSDDDPDSPEKEEDLEKDFRFHPPQSALHLRELVGRAYLLDIAVLGSASDSIVCGVSSVSCRLLGVMMGWDAVVAGDHGGTGRHVWRNVDGSWGWKGIIW